MNIGRSDDDVVPVDGEGVADCFVQFGLVKVRGDRGRTAGNVGRSGEGSEDLAERDASDPCVDRYREDSP